MPRPCYRNIDKPILVLGLEYQDWALVMGIFLCFIILPFLSNVTVLMITAAAWTVIRVLKSSKPSGYLWHLLYRQGISFPYLLPPHTPRYSAFPRQSSGIIWRKKEDSGAVS